MSSPRMTTDHQIIRDWVEALDGRPSVIRTKGKGGVLQIDFGQPEDDFEDIGWDQFFKIFDENKLAFLHQSETRDGEASRFNKLVQRQ